MISGHSSEVVPVIHWKWLRSFIGSGSGYLSGVVPVIHWKWFQLFIESGRMLRNIDGYSSKVAIFAVRGARDFLASLTVS